jgi:tRNA (guanine26-N2/guanine27-N2)-dimethyltransferase
MELGTKKVLSKLISVCETELPTASFYDYHHMAKKLNISPPPVDTIIERLRGAGFSASRTHFSGTGIKTDAPLKEIYESFSARR